MKLYHELAAWWPLISHPNDYAEEAGTIRATLMSLTTQPLRSLLELGSGGGNNASHLKQHFTLTLVDASAEMLAVSRSLNPDCEHIQGDMRSVRLGRTFDAVLIHDAIGYMTTEAELAAALGTAAAHLQPGGVAVFLPDFTTETFQPSTSHGGEDGEGRGARYLEWCHPTEPGTTFFHVTYAVVLREGTQTRTILDEHMEGLFPRSTWLRLMEAAGFDACVRPYPHSSFAPEECHEMFCGVRRSDAH